MLRRLAQGHPASYGAARDSDHITAQGSLKGNTLPMGYQLSQELLLGSQSSKNQR